MKATRRFLLLLVFSALVPALVGAAAADPDAAIDPVGRPKDFRAGKETSYAVWFEDGQWHLRATVAKGKKTRFEGRINVEKGTFTDGNFEELEKSHKKVGSDWAVCDRDRKRIDFIFGNTGGIDGVDFKVSDSATALSFGLLVNHETSPKFISIGRGGVAPATNPFTLNAHPSEDSSASTKTKKADKDKTDK